MALGIAAAAVDCVRELQPRPGVATAERLAELDARIASVRALVVHAARAVDATGDGRPASAAKARACELAEDATLEAAELLGPSARTESPRLAKQLRGGRIPLALSTVTTFMPAMMICSVRSNLRVSPGSLPLHSVNPRSRRPHHD